MEIKGHARKLKESDLSASSYIPDDNACFHLWDKYQMLDNIRRHSLMVAHICQQLAERSKEVSLDLSVEKCRAAGLLHDLAKTWCLRNGGSHSMLGSSWIVMETGNYEIAQGTLLHVHWPWKLPDGARVCCLPIFLIYADKRVRHDECVTLGERFEDLIVRYGHTKEARAGIMETRQQAFAIESALSQQLDWDLHEDTFD